MHGFLLAVLIACSFPSTPAGPQSSRSHNALRRYPWTRFTLGEEIRIRPEPLPGTGPER